MHVLTVNLPTRATDTAILSHMQLCIIPSIWGTASPQGNQMVSKMDIEMKTKENAAALAVSPHTQPPGVIAAEYQRMEAGLRLHSPFL